MSFQEHKQITKTFGIELSTEEKYKFTVETRNQKPPIIRRKNGGFLSSYHYSQMKLDDFNGNYVLSHNFKSVKSKNIQGSNEDSLLSDDDFLINFYIRK